uniref:Pumilio-like protein 3 n=1 Tax=Enchytraeus coronatus TaxID=208440 RepID=A0AAU7VFU8_9ANNE
MGKPKKQGKKSKSMDFEEVEIEEHEIDDEINYNDNDSEMSIDVDEPIVEMKPKKNKKTEIVVDKKLKKSEKAVNKSVNPTQTMQDFKEAVKKVRKEAKKPEIETKKVTPGKKRKQPDSQTESDKKRKLDEMTFKERKDVRKKQNKNYENAKIALRLWEKLRVFDQSPDERKKVYDELYRYVAGNAAHFINAHDTARVVQTLIKYGTAEQRNTLFNELKEHILEMMKSLYAKFIVRKFLKYGTKGQRDCIFTALKGHIRKLVRHKEAADIIECAYNMFANATQRAAMVEEFYGPLFLIYKTDENRTLAQVLVAHPDKSESILTSMKETLTALVEKNSLQYSFVHKLFLDYFLLASDKLRAEMIETIRESTIHMLHTREGARVAMSCLWHGTAKDRKATVKSFKNLVEKICKEEYGHMVMLALFDVVDDTKLVSKAILDELLKCVDVLAGDQYGRKVLLYLLQSRDTLHFHPDIVSVLTQGDGNAHSKKDAQIRREELLTHVSRPLVQWIAQHAQEYSVSSSMLPLIVSIIQHVKCDRTEAMRSISQVAALPYSAGADHIVEHPAGHLTLKRLIVSDNERIKNSETVLFSNILLDVVPETSLTSWTSCNRGCFICVSLLEVQNEEVTKRVAERLSSAKPALKTRTFKGAQILLEKLK